MKISLLTKDKVAEWDTCVYNSPEATFFHLSGWKTIIEKTFRHKSYYLYAEQAGDITGILPLFHIKSFLFGNSLVSIPFGVYGGVCADDKDTEILLFKEAQQLAKSLNVGWLELRNIQEKQYDKELIKGDLYARFEYKIQNTVEDNLKFMDDKRRRTIRKSLKNNLQIEITRDHIEEFYRLFAHNMKHHGTPVYSINYFKNILDTFKDAKIFFVKRDDVYIAGSLTFFFKDRIIPFYVGALEEYFKYGIYEFMYWKMICYGCDNGFKIFDFGRSKRNSGSYKYKKFWGIEPIDFPYQYFLVKAKSLPKVNPTNPKYKLFIEIWKKLPLNISTIIGPAIVKNIP